MSISKARQRIISLLDANSFVEIGAGVQARATDLNTNPAQLSSDGVITGYGLIDDSLVYVYSQDSAVLGGSIGEMHARKIAGLYDLAVRTGAPVVGLIDSSGIRLQEGIDALEGLSKILAKQAMAKTEVPTISAIFGRCGGGLALSAAMSDLKLMAADAQLFLNAPNAIAGNREDLHDTSSAAERAAEGVVDFIGTEEEVLAQARQLISMLPANYEDESCAACTDDLNRDCAATQAMIADPAALARELADDGVFVEIRSANAQDMVTGLARLGGTLTGIIGNREIGGESVLTAEGCRKAEDLVDFCDRFEIPLVTLTNVTGFKASLQSENSTALAAGRLTAAFAAAGVPRINVITGKVMGSAYAVMNPKALGADLTISLPDTQIGIMEPAMAARVLAGTDGNYEAACKQYAEKHCSLDAALHRGVVDQVVSLKDLRRYLISSLEILYTKR